MWGGEEGQQGQRRPSYGSRGSKAEGVSARAWPPCGLGAVRLSSLSCLVGSFSGEGQHPIQRRSLAGGFAGVGAWGEGAGRGVEGGEWPVMGAVSVEVGKGRRGSL